MAEAGHEVTMLTTSAQLAEGEVPEGEGVIRRGVIGGVNCIVLDIPYNQTMNYAQRMLSFLKFMVYCCKIVLNEPKPDVIYATSTPLTVGVPALIGRWVREIPYYFEVRDPWPEMPIAMGIIRNRWIGLALKLAERLIYQQADTLVAVNSTLARAMRGDIGRANPMVIVPNACDTDLFGPTKACPEFRKKHGFEDKILCVYTGAMGAANHLDYILDAAEQLKDHPQVMFALIGSGREKERLQQRIDDDGISNVRIIDSMPKEELVGVMATVDVGILNLMPIPVMEQNGSNKFADYLASGCAVVITHKGWQAELLEKYHAGLSSRQGDLDGFIASLRKLADDAEFRAACGKGARRLAETEMNRHVCVKRLTDSLDAFAMKRRLA